MAKCGIFEEQVKGCLIVARIKIRELPRDATIGKEELKRLFTGMDAGWQPGFLVRIQWKTPSAKIRYPDLMIQEDQETRET